MTGNDIGLNLYSYSALGNQLYGIEVDAGPNTTISGNSIGANDIGIVLEDGTQNDVIRENNIGISGIPTGLPYYYGVAVGNRLQGIALRSIGTDPAEPGVQNNLIGGTGASDGNVIAYNGAAGVAVFGNPVAGSGQGNTGNAIEGNLLFGSYPFVYPSADIDLTNEYPFPTEYSGLSNDSRGHGGASPNNFQNYPIITSVVVSSTGTTLTGTLTQGISPNTTFRVELFAHDSNPRAHSGGREFFLTAVNLTTDASGVGQLTMTVAGSLLFQQTVRATAPAGRRWSS